MKCQPSLKATCIIKLILHTQCGGDFGPPALHLVPSSHLDNTQCTSSLPPIESFSPKAGGCMSKLSRYTDMTFEVRDEGKGANLIRSARAARVRRRPLITSASGHPMPVHARVATSLAESECRISGLKMLCRSQLLEGMTYTYIRTK